MGIRMEGCRPVGSSVERGGDTNGPAAVYSIVKYLDWMKKYAPPQAQGMTFSESGPVPAQGAIAQQIFWYTAFTADMVAPGIPVMNADGTPKWRMAPSPHGSYWKEGMKLGYQDAGSATLLKSTPADRRKAAWLYLQFIVSKTVSLKKSHVGLTFIRESDIWDKSFTERAPKLGGLIEFYRSPARVQWTPTGNNVPDYPKLAQLWWQNIGDASSGAKTPQAAMDALAAAQDSVMERLEKSGVQGACGPKLNKKETAEYWFKKAEKDGTIAPQRKLANEKPKGETVDYDALIKSWPATPPSALRCSESAVIVRLDRTIQYAAASRLYRCRLRLLDAPLSRGMTRGETKKAGSNSGLFLSSSLRANGSRECAPNDRLREAIHRYGAAMDCFVASLLAMTLGRQRPIAPRRALRSGRDNRCSPWRRRRRTSPCPAR